MEHFFEKEDMKRMGKFLLFLVISISLFFLMKFVNEIKQFQRIGISPETRATIDVSGEGISYALPDTATISFSVEAKGATIASAQNLVALRMNQAIDFLNKSNIDKSEIQTTDYNSYPEYNTPNPCVFGMPCLNSNQPSKIIDYVSNESVTVKIKDTNTAGGILDGLGKVGVSSIQGPDFSVGDPDAVKADARNKAISDAKQKAQLLAKQLGVNLGTVVRFSDNSGGGIMPMMFGAKADSSIGSDTVSSSDTNVQTGQNKYVSDVTITYEIY